MLPIRSLACFLALSTALNAQDLPTIQPSSDPVRPLETADAVRGWEAIGRLDTGVSFCSATLITQDLILTAAHCLFDGSGARIPTENLTFQASLRNGRAEAYRSVADAYLPEGYARPEGRPSYDTVSDDIALLALSHPIAQANISPIPVGTGGSEADFVTIVSYGRDREAYASIEEDCQILSTQAPVQILSCSVVPGTSGAPILRESGTGAEIIGVVSASGDWREEEVGIAIATDTILPELISAYQASRTGTSSAFGNVPTGIRRLTVGDTSREGIGARFIRP